MTTVVEIHAVVPAGPLTVADMQSIHVEAPFEIVDGRLELMAPPAPWHQFMTRDVEHYLAERYPAAVSDVPLAVGANGRRPDVMAVTATRDELLRTRLQVLTPDRVAVVAEVISHDDDKARDEIAVRRDREEKFVEYSRAGIAQYWLLDEISDDPTDASVEIYHLRDGRYVPVLTTRLSRLTSGADVPPALS